MRRLHCLRRTIIPFYTHHPLRSIRSKVMTFAHSKQSTLPVRSGLFVMHPPYPWIAMTATSMLIMPIGLVGKTSKFTFSTIPYPSAPAMTSTPLPPVAQFALYLRHEPRSHNTRFRFHEFSITWVNYFISVLTVFYAVYSFSAVFSLFYGLFFSRRQHRHADSVASAICDKGVFHNTCSEFHICFMLLTFWFLLFSPP